MRIDAEAIGDEEERVWYGFGCLSGDAAGRIHPWMQYAQKSEDFTVKGFLKQIDQAFADPQKQAKALDKINRIRQGHRDFRIFLQEFEQTLLEAQGWGWADEVKKGYLRAALNKELCDRLVTQVEPDQYSEFTSQLRMISDKLQRIKAWDSHHSRNRAHNMITPSNTLHTQESMDWEATGVVNVAATDLRTQARARWVDRAEIDQRMSNGSCLRCGKQSHIIKNCQLLPARNPNRQMRTQYQETKSKPTLGKVRVAATASPKSGTEILKRRNQEAEEWESEEDSEKE